MKNWSSLSKGALLLAWHALVVLPVAIGAAWVCFHYGLDWVLLGLVAVALIGAVFSVRHLAPLDDRLRRLQARW